VISFIPDGSGAAVLDSRPGRRMQHTSKLAGRKSCSPRKAAAPEPA
jgi:hypothetical protein